MSIPAANEPKTKPSESEDKSSAVAGNPMDLVRFTLSGQLFALEISQVQEVVRIPHITRVPNTGPGILGVMNLRGNIIPIIDLNAKFGFPSVGRTEKSRIIIIKSQGQYLGFQADGVSEIIHANENDIVREHKPNTEIDPACILGALDLAPEKNGKMDTALTVLANLDTLLQKEPSGQDDQQGDAKAGKQE